MKTKDDIEAPWQILSSFIFSLPCGEQKRQNAANDIATDWENADSNVRPTVASIA
jgi:hypothetical protein